MTALKGYKFTVDGEEHTTQTRNVSLVCLFTKGGNCGPVPNLVYHLSAAQAMDEFSLGEVVLTGNWDHIMRMPLSALTVRTPKILADLLQSKVGKRRSERGCTLRRSNHKIILIKPSIRINWVIPIYVTFTFSAADGNRVLKLPSKHWEKPANQQPLAATAIVDMRTSFYAQSKFRPAQQLDSVQLQCSQKQLKVS
ncbi:hypothetical protein Ancab_004843 [Ancistrocladus abbreviatus]